jgi:hypothetical protein
MRKEEYLNTLSSELEISLPKCDLLHVQMYTKKSMTRLELIIHILGFILKCALSVFEYRTQ